MLVKISMNTGSEKTEHLKIAVILLPLPFESPGVSPVDSLVCILPELSDEPQTFVSPTLWDYSINYSSISLPMWHTGKESACQCRYSPWGRKELDTTERPYFMANAENMSLIPGPGRYSILAWKIP